MDEILFGVAIVATGAAFWVLACLVGGPEETLRKFARGARGFIKLMDWDSRKKKNKRAA